METVGHDSLCALLARAGIKMADPALRIGRQLSFAPPPARTVVIHHLATATDQIARVTAIILSTDAAWFVVPRYGDAIQLCLVGTTSETGAVGFAASERALLGRYLCERSMRLEDTSTDLHAVGAAGNVLVTWDHHTADEGLVVGLRRVDDAGRLLVSLNELGTDFEVSSGATDRA